MKIKDDVEVIASLVEKLMNGFHSFWNILWVLYWPKS